MLSREMMFKLFAVLFVLKSVTCGFFDLTDIDDPLALLWHTKDSIIGTKGQCSVEKNGIKYSGTCKHTSHCLLSGGTPIIGGCGFLKACCVENRGCEGKSNAKTFYIESGNDIKVGRCKYTIELANSNVCQVRLDFENFHLSPTEFDENERRFVCKHQYLTIDPSTYGIPVLCGYNNGQHVYVHVNQTELARKEVSLKFRIANLTSHRHPSWKIKVTQLECPGYKFDLFHHKDNDVVKDFPALAPSGAIQYFTELTGVIRSFGYKPGATLTDYPYSYVSGQRYAIAFKRHVDDCRILFTGREVMRIFRDPLEDPETTPRDLGCVDYLFVPELTYEINSVTQFIAKVCPTQTTSFTSLPPGPFYVYFVSVDRYEAATPPKPPRFLYAFDIDYQIDGGCQNRLK